MVMLHGPSGESRKPQQHEMSVAGSLDTVLLSGQLRFCMVCVLMKGDCVH